MDASRQPMKMDGRENMHTELNSVVLLGQGPLEIDAITRTDSSPLEKEQLSTN